MRITKLHLLLFFIFSSFVYYGHYFWSVKQKEAREQEEQLRIELEARRKAEEKIAKQSAVPPAPPPAIPAPAPEETLKKEPAPVSYVVQRGDTLWKIAKMKEHFGQGHRWYDIWKANEDAIEDFDKIEAGQSLTIPADKPENYRWSKTSERRKSRLLRSGSPVKISAKIKTGTEPTN